MKSLVYLSVAVPALLLGAPAFAGHDSPNSEPYGAEYAPSASYDASAYNWDDRVYSQQETQSGVYDGTWTGNYVDDQGRVYQGEWNGTYVDEDGVAHQGNYRGTSIGAPRYDYQTGGAQGTPYSHDGDRMGGPAAYYGDATGQRGPAYGRPSYRGPERRDNGVGGAVIGGVAGGVAGNLIAGRGNRLAGTLIGSGVGAVAGYAVDRAEDDGRSARRGYTSGRGYDRPVGRQRYMQQRGLAGRYPGASAMGGYHGAPTGYGWQSQGSGYAQNAYSPNAYNQGGYYYAQPQAYVGGTTTVVVVPGQTTATTTTTVTEEYVGSGTTARHDKRLLRKGGCNC